MSQEQVEAIVRALTLLAAAYEPDMEPLDLDKVDAQSYAMGFRNGARSAYMDAVCRLREVRPEIPSNVTRIGSRLA